MATLLIIFVVTLWVFYIVYWACLTQHPSWLWRCAPATAEIIGHQLRERMGP